MTSAIDWQAHRTHAQQLVDAVARGVAHESIERDKEIVHQLDLVTATLAEERARATRQHAAVMAELAQLGQLAGGDRVSARLAKLERDAADCDRRVLLALRQAREQQQRANLRDGVHLDPEATGVHRVARLEQTIHELEIAMAKTEAKDEERREARRSLADDEREERREERADRRAWTWYALRVGGAIVLALSAALVGRVTGRTVELQPLPMPSPVAVPREPPAGSR